MTYIDTRNQSSAVTVVTPNLFHALACAPGNHTARAPALQCLNRHTTNLLHQRFNQLQRCTFMTCPCSITPPHPSRRVGVPSPSTRTLAHSNLTAAPVQVRPQVLPCLVRREHVRPHAPCQLSRHQRHVRAQSSAKQNTSIPWFSSKQCCIISGQIPLE